MDYCERAVILSGEVDELKLQVSRLSTELEIIKSSVIGGNSKYRDFKTKVYICEDCSFNTSNEQDFTKHRLSRRHIRKTSAPDN
jgi:hypothetical protein